MNQRHHADHSEAMGSVAGPDATAARAAVPVGSNHTQRTPSHTRLLLGGFFVLVALIFITPALPRAGVETGIPNDALVALILPAGSPARDTLIRLAPALAVLEPLATHEVALVALGEPFMVGIVASVPYPEDLLTLSQAGLPTTPLHHRLVAIGEQNFGTRLRESRAIPWWIRLQAKAIKNQHAGALLFARNTTSPWVLGSIEADDSGIRLFTPLPRAVRQTPRALESDLQEIIFNLAQLLLPTTSSLRLPDNTIVQELRQEAAALSWSIEEKNGPTHTLLQNNKPALFYKRLKEKGDCSDKNAFWGVGLGTYPPLPELKLEISLLKQAIFFCISGGDKL